MHGLGNDFVVIDARTRPFTLSAAQAAAIADRRRGIGCDQIIVLEAGQKSEDAFMRIRNADGSASAACGNATRCIGGFLMDESGKSRIVIGSEAGDLFADRSAGGEVTIDFGAPRLKWNEVPLSHEVDTLHLPLAAGPVADPAACSMGNPHGTFFVDDVEALDIAAIGPTLEFAPIFPERANIGFAQVLTRGRIRMRVWERGAGITLACGTGACATLVNAVRRGLADRKARLVLDGGTLAIEWRESDDHVLMTGAVAIVARGVIDPSLLAEPASAPSASAAVA
ncbi:MAG TPA: diaminopimelate epimerase [Alphaproteobacteria bacterium]